MVQNSRQDSAFGGARPHQLLEFGFTERIWKSGKHSTRSLFSFYYSAITEISSVVFERDRLLSSSARSHWSIGRKTLHEWPPYARSFHFRSSNMPTTAQEWAAFMALVPYFSAHPAASKIRHRLLAALQQCKDPVVSRDALLLRAGLSFFADDLNVDLALMQFVREGWLAPIVDRPFTFALNLTYSKTAERCLSSRSNPPGGE
jgi:hypothetical protein